MRNRNLENFRLCLECGKKFYSYPSRFKIGKGKHCSKKCLAIYKTGKPAWNTGKLYPQATGDKNNNWRGDKVGYDGIHRWINYHKGKPTKCEHCGKDGLNGKQIQWANKDHTYKRNLTDWIRLCASCHSKYDLKNNSKLGRKYI